jgi:hypothetical protein
VYLNNTDLSQKYLLGTLRVEKCESLEISLNIGAFSNITLSVDGPGEVNITGKKYRY